MYGISSCLRSKIFMNRRRQYTCTIYTSGNLYGITRTKENILQLIAVCYVKFVYSEIIINNNYNANMINPNYHQTSRRVITRPHLDWYNGSGHEGATILLPILLSVAPFTNTV